MTFLLAIVLQAGLSGTVVHDGNPVAGARVIAGELGRALLPYKAPRETCVATPGIPAEDVTRWSALLVTDDGGRFSAPRLAPGEYTVLVADGTAPCRGIAFTTIKLREGEPRALR